MKADEPAGGIRLEPGVHFLCTCGKSSHAPFCDGSHKGTGCRPVRWEAAKEESLPADWRARAAQR